MSSAPLEPEVMDSEVVLLCEAMNKLDGIETVSSCCGHGKDHFGIWFAVKKVDALLPLLFWTDPCHGAPSGWGVSASTDCGADHVTFRLRGPVGAFDAANVIAELLGKKP